jgi:polyphenol oxidase
MGREMAGSYVCLNNPRMDGTGKRMGVKTSMRVALNELLEDLGTDRDESVTVTLVPRHGKVKIGGLRIVYMVEWEILTETKCTYNIVFLLFYEGVVSL